MLRIWLFPLLLIIESRVAGAEPKFNPDLDQIKIISYVTYIGGEQKGKCRVNAQAMETALQFVANQSTGLKTLSYQQYSDEVDKFSKKLKPNDDAGLQEFLRYNSTPLLHLHLTVIEMGSGCAGVLNATLQASVEATRIVATNRYIRSPYVEIWTWEEALKSSHGEFEQLAINETETALKTFVNTWTKSQSQP
jgi:hypothetical protein